MGVNKVVYSGRALIDLTADTVTPEMLAEGITAHNAAGEQIIGTMKKTTTYITFEKSDFENGLYNGVGEKIDNNKTLRTKQRYSVSYGDSVHITQNNSQYATISNFYDGSFHDLCAWMNVDTTVNIEHSGEIAIFITKDTGYASGGGLNISPEEYIEQVYLTKK